MKKIFNIKKGALLVALSIGSYSIGQAITTFDYTGSVETFVVPLGVTSEEANALH